jgi:hypothetical protein
MMSKIDELASQLTNDPLIDELTDLLYEAAIRSSTPREEIGEIVRGFLAAYADADRVLCSVCIETKADYIRQQWQKVWLEVVRRIQQEESGNKPFL